MDNQFFSIKIKSKHIDSFKITCKALVANGTNDDLNANCYRRLYREFYRL